MIPMVPMPPVAPIVPGTRKPPVSPDPNIDQAQTNQMQVEALGGPTRKPPVGFREGEGDFMTPRRPPVTRRPNSGTADDQSYMDQLRRKQGQNNPAYHGFHAPKPAAPLVPAAPPIVTR